MIFFQGVHSVDQEVFLSVPVVLSKHGVGHVVKQPLNDAEQEALLKSASLMHEVQSNLNL